MTPEQEVLKLFDALRAAGWQDEDVSLIAPGRSMWLYKEVLWWGHYAVLSFKCKDAWNGSYGTITNRRETYLS